jgi:hypothetical protein
MNFNPYKALGDHIKKIKQDRALKFLKSDKVGVKVAKEDIEIIDPSKFADIDPNTSYYYYDGPLDEKTREFCLEMLIQGKFYSQEEMDYLSTKLGYNVDLYCGSYNCRHQWKRARIKQRIQSGNLDKSAIATDADARKAASKQSPELKG